jgi:hypothetical protein
MDSPEFAHRNLPQGVGLPSTKTLTTSIPLNNTPSPALAFSQAIHSTTKLSYNNGYGDFCFGRLVNRHGPASMKISPLAVMELQ